MKSDDQSKALDRDARLSVAQTSVCDSPDATETEVCAIPMISALERMRISRFTAITHRGVVHRRSLHRKRYLKAGSLDFLRTYFGRRFHSFPAQPFSEEKIYRQAGHFSRSLSIKSLSQFFMSLDFTLLAQSLHSSFYRSDSRQVHFLSQFLNLDKHVQSAATMRAESIQTRASPPPPLSFASPQYLIKARSASLSELAPAARLWALPSTPQTALQILARQNFVRHTLTNQASAGVGFARRITVAAEPISTTQRVERTESRPSFLDRVFAFSAFALAKFVEKSLPRSQPHLADRTTFRQALTYILNQTCPKVTETTLKQFGLLRRQIDLHPLDRRIAGPLADAHHPAKRLRQQDAEVITRLFPRTSPAFLGTSQVQTRQLAHLPRVIDSRGPDFTLAPRNLVFVSAVSGLLNLSGHAEVTGPLVKSTRTTKLIVDEWLRIAPRTREMLKTLKRVRVANDSQRGTPVSSTEYAVGSGRLAHENNVTTGWPGTLASHARRFWQTKSAAVMNYSRSMLERSLAAGRVFGAGLLKQFTFAEISGVAGGSGGAAPQRILNFNAAARTGTLSSPPEFVSVRHAAPAVSAARVETKLETREILELVKNQVNKSLTSVMSARHFSSDDYADISDRVYSLLIRRLTIERERLGLR